VFVFRNFQDVDSNDVHNDDTETEDDTDQTSESSKEESNQVQQGEKLVLEGLPVDITVTPNPSKPVVNNKAPPNTNNLVEEPPQGIIEAEEKIVAASADNYMPTSAAQSQGVDLTLPSSEESQSEEHSHEPVLDPKKRARTKNRTRVKKRPERPLAVGGTGYQPGRKQHKFQRTTKCVQCSDVTDMPLHKPDIIMPK